MKEILTLVFLTLSYNFILWVITENGLIPVPLFPNDLLTGVLLFSFNTSLFLSWVFGERKRAVLWITALFLMQTVGLAIILGEYSIITEILTPLTLTYSFVVLFESPTEKRLRALIEENEALLEELERNRRELQALRVAIGENNSKMEELLKEKRSLEIKLKDAGLTKVQKEKLEEEKRNLESRIEEYNKELKALKSKEMKLVEANRRLFSLLEALRDDEAKSGKGRELINLRRERKKLLKEIFELQDLLDFYAEENEKLSREREELKEQIEELSKELFEKELRIEKLQSAKRKMMDIYGEVLAGVFRSFTFTDRALEEFIRLDIDRKKALLRELIRIDYGLKELNYEPLANKRDVFKIKFQGGRAYFTLSEGKRLILGILDSEDDKDKSRYIEELIGR